MALGWNAVYLLLPGHETHTRKEGRSSAGNPGFFARDDVDMIFCKVQAALNAGDYENCNLFFGVSVRKNFFCQCDVLGVYKRI